MPNPYVIQGAAQATKSIFDFIGGNSEAKRQEELKRKELARLRKLLGQDYIDVNSIQSAGDRAIVQNANKLGSRLDKSLNLDTGQGAGGIAERLAGQRADNRVQLLKTNEVGKANRDTRIQDQITQVENFDVKKPSSAGLLGSLIGTAGQTYAQILQQKQAEKAQQEALATAPRPAMNNSFSEYDVQKPAQGGMVSPALEDPTKRYYEQLQLQSNAPAQTQRSPFAGYGAIENATNPNIGTQPQQTFKSPNEVIAHLLQTGQMSPQDYLTKFGTVGGSKSKQPTDYVSKVGEDYNKANTSYEKSEATYRNSRAGRQGIASPYTKPTVEGSLDLFRSQIDRELGAGAADSVLSVLQGILGGGQDTKVLDWARNNLSPEKFKLFQQKSAQEQMEFYRKYVN